MLNFMRQIISKLRGQGIGIQEIQKLIHKADPVILEIGCHDGTNTRMFLEAFRNARVYAFEPHPEVAAEFRQKAKDPRCRLFELAVCDNDGEAKFYLSSAAAGKKGRGDASSSIKKPAEHMKIYPGIEFKESVTVKAKRLDTWAAENNIGKIDFIWADIQGAERELIRGGLKALEKTDYFYTEFNNRELYEGQPGLRQIRSMLPDFTLLRIYGHNALFKNKRKVTGINDYGLYLYERVINMKNHLTGNIYRI
jgi:FkbM family methyltransferase